MFGIGGRAWRKRNAALGIQHALPREFVTFAHRIENPPDAAGAVRFAGETCDLSVGGDLAARDFFNDRDYVEGKVGHLDGLFHVFKCTIAPCNFNF